jgi:hypothetical protein
MGRSAYDVQKRIFLVRRQVRCVSGVEVRISHGGGYLEGRTVEQRLADSGATVREACLYHPEFLPCNYLKAE